MNNELNESSFAMDSLINFKRPTNLNLTQNQIKYFNKNFYGQ